VNLALGKLPSKDILQTILCHLLPLINSILSIQLSDSAHLVHFYNAGNSKEIYELNMKMMEETRCLGVRYGNWEQSSIRYPSIRYQASEAITAKNLEKLLAYAPNLGKNSY
jgi:hypothetical protein